MINKPGTLLIVRKETKSRREGRWAPYYGQANGIRGVFAIDPEAYPDKYNDDKSYWPEWTDLPFGCAVMLLGMVPVEGSRTGRKNLMKMRLLYGETYLVGELSKNQINKWFTYPNVWKARKQQKTEQKKTAKTTT